MVTTRSVCPRRASRVSAKQGIRAMNASLARRSPISLAVHLLAICACAAAGCKSFHFEKPKSLWPLDVETQPQTPARMAVIWSDTVLYLPNQPPTRGFGGRIYFYDERHDAIPA